jgi:hypothetical protein
MVDLNSKTLIDFILAWDFLIFEMIYMNFGIFFNHRTNVGASSLKAKPSYFQLTLPR